MSDKTKEELDDKAIKYADSKERRLTGAWEGLKKGFIDGYKASQQTAELEAEVKRLREALYSIATATLPFNERECHIFIEVATSIANEALNKQR